MGQTGITSLLVEGGKKTLENFINQKLINEFATYLSPAVIAGCNPKEKLIFQDVSFLGEDLLINSYFKETTNV